MTIQFYFAPFSTSNITQAVLAELGVTCERIELSIDAGDTRKPSFLAINPNGRVPVLVVDGVVLWEAAAITSYLGETYGVDVGLYPPAGLERGQAMSWITWTNTELAQAAGRLSAQLPPDADGAVQEGSTDVLTTSQRSDDEFNQARRDLEKHLGVLDAALTDKDYVLGDFTLADTHLWVIVGWVSALGIGLSGYRNVSAWSVRIDQRPAMRSAFSR